jgi:UTP-glucose-1-phosphate uridylyltransferase
MATLIILAAGLGSRFGGNKQLAEFGKRKLTLMEYNILNAVAAGFSHVIFVIRPELEALFNEQVLPRLPSEISYKLVYQRLDILPSGYKIPTERIKPLGTAHALWCCYKEVNSSFAVINADDYYGAEAFTLLVKQSIKAPNSHLMVAYYIQNTLSDFGGVNRGLCQLTPENRLTGIEECEDISKTQGVITGTINNQEERVIIKHDSLISMNCWFFTPDIFTYLAKEIKLILKKSNESNSNALADQANLKRECYLPDVIMKQIQQQNKQVMVLSTKNQWFGLTYSEDSALVNEKISIIFS